MQYEIEHNERAAVKAVPLSEKTQKLAAELSALHAERESVTPEIERLLAKAADTDTEKLVTKLTPLRVRQEVVGVKLTQKRQAVFDAIVADSAAWQNATEAEVETADKAFTDAKVTFSTKVNAAFGKADAAKMLKGSGNCSGSEDVRLASVRRGQAHEAAQRAAIARRCLDRARSVELVEAGRAVSTGRGHVQPVAFYWQNAAIVCPALMD